MKQCHCLRGGRAAAIVALIVALVLPDALLLAQDISDDSNGGRMSNPEFYVGKLLGTREGWPNNMTKHEEEVMSEHFVYLRDLTQRQKCVAAGPVFDSVPYGLIIMQVESEAEARTIMDNDPSVKSGVHTYDLAKMRLALLMENHFPFRYVQDQSDREIHKEIVVDCPVSEAWRLWTTSDGIRSFFGADAYVELRVGGPFEVYFDMSASYGSRGAEGCRILSYLPERMLSFEWNAPPKFEELRFIKTRVVLDFAPEGENRTKLTLTHVGWGKSDNWDGVYDYFDSAWSSVLKGMQEFVAGR